MRFQKIECQVEIEIRSDVTKILFWLDRDLLVKRKLFETETDVLAAESPLVASVFVVRGDGNGDWSKYMIVSILYKFSHIYWNWFAYLNFLALNFGKSYYRNVAQIELLHSPADH